MANPILEPEDAQAEDVLRDILAKDRPSRGQIEWLLRYVRRLRDERKEPQGNVSLT